MLFRRKPRWLRSKDCLINLDKVESFIKDIDGVIAFFDGGHGSRLLRDITLDDIHYVLKHGKPRKAGK